jgi:uncharacterized protein
MKCIALTDIHAAYRIAEDIVNKESPDLLIIGGDLTTVGSVSEAESALDMLQRSVSQIFSVAGNMDIVQHDELYQRRGISLNARGVIIGDIGFFGVSGAPISRLHTPYEITEEEISRRIMEGYRQVQTTQRKILISHTPPYGTRVDLIHSGFHVGSTAVRDFIEDYQPDLVICGHIHESRGKDQIEKSRIINCGAGKEGNYGLIEIYEDRITVENLNSFSASG